MKILFVLPCTPYFPSGIARVERYFPYLDQKNIQYKWINFNAGYVQRWLHWLDISIFAKYKFSNLIFRMAFHLSGFPYRWFRIFQILLIAKNYHMIFLQAILPPLWFSKFLSYLHKQVVFDFDDALNLRNEKRTQGIIRYSWRVIAGSQVLYDYALQYNKNSLYLPSCVPIHKYTAIMNYEGHKPIRLGWIGSESTLNQLAILEKPLRTLLGNNFKFDLFIAGSRKLSSVLYDIPQLNIIDIAQYNDDDIPNLVNEIDIGLMPLYDLPIEQGKCGLKLLIYMAGAIPTISSPVGEANKIINNGVNGLFAITEEDWINHLGLLMNNQALRETLGKAGRKTVETSYTDRLGFQILEENILNKISNS